MKEITYTITLLLFILFIQSCATKTIYVPIENTKVEKEYVDRWQKDSIYLHDSIFIKHKGDTVWLEKYKTLYKERRIRDSIFVTDSIRIEIPYPVVEIKEVNRMKNWQIALMGLGCILIGIASYRVIRFFK